MCGAVENPSQEAREAYGCRLILVRPDQFVAWTGDVIPDDPKMLMRKVTGQPQSSAH